MTSLLLPSASSFSVNSTVAGDQSAPAIAVLADGSYVIAWQSQMPGVSADGLAMNGWDVMLQRYGANDARLGGETGLALTGHDQVQPALAALAGGGFALAMASDSDYDGRVRSFDAGVFVTTFDASGRAGETTELSGALLGDQDDPSIAGLATGGFATTWHTVAQPEGSGAAAGVVGPTANGAGGLEAEVASLAGGGYVVTWQGMEGVFVQRFTSPGVAASQPSLVAGSAGGASPAVTGLDGGGYAIAWDASDGVHVQKFGANGLAASTAVVIGGAAAEAPAIGALADGGFAVGWADAASAGQGVFLAQFDAAGQRIGGTLQVGATRGDIGEVSLAGTHDGGVVAAWAALGADGSGWGIEARHVGAVDLDVNGHAAQAWRLYRAAFDRTPDGAGLQFQAAELDSGHTLSQVAGNFIASPEFQRTYGTLDDARFVTTLYENVLHREPESAGLAYHLDRLAHGAQRADILVGFSESPENQAAVVGSMEASMADLLLIA